MKKKIFVITLAVCLLALSIAGTSMAYFTDVENATNVFTAGNVDITLTYNGKTADTDTSAEAIAIETKAYPGQKYTVNAAISNVGSENAYVGAIITLTNENAKLSEVITLGVEDEGDIPSELKDLFTTLEKDGYSVQYKTITDGTVTKGYEIYVIKTAALAAKNGATVDSAVIFESFKIPATWDNAQMKLFADSKITVKAYATQTVGEGFENAASALYKAFPDVWPNPANP